MKKVLLVIALGIAAVFAYTFNFTTFHEAWIPYYYEDHLIDIYLGGLALILVAPMFGAFLLKSSDKGIGIGLAYLNAALFLNAIVLASCLVLFIYMLNNGIFLGNQAPGIYKIEAAE